MCAILAGAALFLYWLLDIVFDLIISTQGDAVKQALLWGLYQIRRTKTYTLKARLNMNRDLGTVSQTNMTADNTMNNMYTSNQAFGQDFDG